jgi:hypothetical protein
LIGLLAVVLVLSFNVGGAANQGAAAAKPRLRVAALSTFTVVGTGFRPGETVRVSAHTPERDAAKQDVADADGSFSVRLGRLKLDKCPDYMIAASGNKGSRAVQRSIPRACGIDPKVPR